MDTDDNFPLWPVVVTGLTAWVVLLLGAIYGYARPPTTRSDDSRSFTIEANSAEPSAVGAVTITNATTLLLAAFDGDTPLSLDRQLRELPDVLAPNAVVEHYTFMRVKADDGEWVAETITFRNEQTGLTRTLPAPTGGTCEEEVGDVARGG